MTRGQRVPDTSGWGLILVVVYYTVPQAEAWGIRYRFYFNLSPFKQRENRSRGFGETSPTGY